MGPPMTLTLEKRPKASERVLHDTDIGPQMQRRRFGYERRRSPGAESFGGRVRHSTTRSADGISVCRSRRSVSSGASVTLTTPASTASA